MTTHNKIRRLNDLKDSSFEIFSICRKPRTKDILNTLLKSGEWMSVTEIQLISRISSHSATSTSCSQLHNLNLLEKRPGEYSLRFIEYRLKEDSLQMIIDWIQLGSELKNTLKSTK